MTRTVRPKNSSVTPREGMFRELLYIHSILRRDLKTVRRLAQEIRDGGPAEAIVAEIRELGTNSPLWQLKYGCIYYCRFVHSHHTIEDVALFPMVRKQDPSLGGVVDRLEEDHLKVHHITEEIVTRADDVASQPSAENRVALLAALVALEEHLLEHLAFEEDSLGPLLSTWERWPVE